MSSENNRETEETWLEQMAGFVITIIIPLGLATITVIKILEDEQRIRGALGAVIVIGLVWYVVREIKKSARKKKAS